MDAPDFAQQFGQLYRELYRLAVRRVSDGREPLSAETTALLLHLAQTGPMSLSQLARHFGRALLQWALRENPALARAQAEANTLEYMARMPAWAQHPRVRAARGDAAAQA
jgi:hypothetical protein